jgi:formylglycine-generating enzyme required for sulfatase activity
MFAFYPQPDCPMGGLLWYEAAAYCNWLSEQEGIPKDQWCYADRPATEGMRIKENYLELVGYRLPTEPEWEFACRAGTLTSRYYGSSEVLLSSYAWYAANSQGLTWPVGSLKPNDYGLFDMLGNVSEWCQGAYQPYVSPLPAEVSHMRDVLPVKNTSHRVGRGFCFGNDYKPVRSGNHFAEQAGNRVFSLGFRPARTYP